MPKNWLKRWQQNVMLIIRHHPMVQKIAILHIIRRTLTRRLCLVPSIDVHQLSVNMTSVREIERETGLDFFSAMPADLQQRFETEPARGMW